MKQTTLLSTVTIMALFALIGCGSSTSLTSTEDETSIDTGTGYYVDSAVEGVKYRCGTLEDVTGKTGNFTFEKGQACTFYLGDIPIRTLDQTRLTDGETIVEDNVSVASLLQSLDSDGDARNGITLTQEAVDALEKTLKAQQPEASVPKLPTTDSEIEVLVASVAESLRNSDFAGHFVSTQEALEHVKNTQTGITTGVFAGKRFYVPYLENGKSYIEKITISDDAKSATWEKVLGASDAGTFVVSIDGNTITLEDSNQDVAMVLELVDVADDYVEVKRDDLYMGKFYFSYDDAQNALSTTLVTLQSDLQDATVGKTLYMVEDDTLKSLTFGLDNIIYEGSKQYAYRIDGLTLYTTNDEGQEEAHLFLGADAERVRFQESDGSITIFYTSPTLAQENPVS